MDLRSDRYKVPFIVCVITLGILSLGSLLLYRERMFFVDPCWVAFNIINTKTFSIAEHRYGSFITQIYPLVGTYLGFSVNSLLILYSVSFYIFYFGTMLLVGIRWKQRWLGILLTLYFILFVSDVYFWPNNEVHQGITWMCLFVGLYLHTISGKRKPVHHVLLLFFAVMAVSSHLLVALPFVFLWTYYHLNTYTRIGQYFRDRSFVGYSLLIALLIGLRYYLSTHGWYDASKLESVKKVDVAGVLAAWKSGQSMSFLALMLRNYWLSIFIFGGGLAVLLSLKKYLSVALLLISAMAYFSLICITYPDAFGRNMRFYMESEWMGLSFIMATPFVLQVLPRLRSSRLLLTLFVLICGVRLGYIAESGLFFHARYLRLERVTDALHEQGTKKLLIVQEQQRSNDLYIMDWGLPTESMMLSRVKGYSPQVSFKTITPGTAITQPIDSFYSCFSMMPLTFLDSAYFRLDQGRPYTVGDSATLDGLLR